MKTYFTQEALDAVKEKISKFQAGGTTAEIRPDNRSWIRREIVDPVRTWVMTRPGYETVVQTADVVSDFIPSFGDVAAIVRNNAASKKLKEKPNWPVLVKAMYETIGSRPIHEYIIPVQPAPITVWKQLQRLSPKQIQMWELSQKQKFKDNTIHGNTRANKR